MRRPRRAECISELEPADTALFSSARQPVLQCTHGSGDSSGALTSRFTHSVLQLVVIASPRHFHRKRSHKMTLQATFVRTLSSVLMLVALSSTVVVAVVESDAPHLNKGDPVKYKDCGQLLKAGYNVSGVHQLWMNASASFLIQCEFHKGNAFTVIQRRLDSTMSFEQPLSLYISGFGNAQSNYWAGLNTINYLTTAQGNNVLTVHLQDWAGSSVALTYKKFIVLPQDNRYQMQISGYVGPAGLDDLSYHNGATFQTYDYPDPHNCAVYMRVGWWYNYCAYALLNGRYYSGGTYPTPASGYNDGIYWRDWRGYNYSMKFVSMVVSNS